MSFMKAEERKASALIAWQHISGQVLAEESKHLGLDLAHCLKYHAEMTGVAYYFC
jgi:hypothetical protein